MENLTNTKVNWEETKRKLKLKFVVLTDNDLFVNCKQDEMFLRLQTKLGKTREELIKLITGL